MQLLATHGPNAAPSDGLAPLLARFLRGELAPGDACACDDSEER